MHAAQMKDIASWAGKDHAGGLQQKFLDATLAPLHNAIDRRSGVHPEVEKARKVTGMRIQALQAQLQNTPEDAQELELELSRAFSAIGQLEFAAHDDKRATEAYIRAMEHAQAARERAPAGRDSDASWHGAVAQAASAAFLGLCRYGEAKAILKEALLHATEAVALFRDNASEQLACDVVEGIHVAHERTDDRKGLESFVHGLQHLLDTLRLVSGDEPLTEVPIIMATESMPDFDDVVLRARLLERIVLICIATGRDRDSQVAKRVFMEFRVARESSNLRRLLGMLQSSGNFF